jgi:hypothetical protein
MTKKKEEKKEAKCNHNIMVNIIKKSGCTYSTQYWHSLKLNALNSKESQA